MEKLISRNKKDREGYSSPVMTISFPFRSVVEKRLFGRNVSFLTNLRVERISLVRVYDRLRWTESWISWSLTLHPA